MHGAAWMCMDVRMSVCTRGGGGGEGCGWHGHGSVVVARSREGCVHLTVCCERRMRERVFMLLPKLPQFMLPPSLLPPPPKVTEAL